MKRYEKASKELWVLFEFFLYLFYIKNINGRHDDSLYMSGKLLQGRSGIWFRFIWHIGKQVVGVNCSKGGLLGKSFTSENREQSE